MLLVIAKLQTIINWILCCPYRRNTKTLTRGRGRGGRGRSPGSALARQALSQLVEQQSPGTQSPQRGRGRGRGTGRGLKRPVSSPSGATNIQLTVVQEPEEVSHFRRGLTIYYKGLLILFYFSIVGTSWCRTTS